MIELDTVQKEGKLNTVYAAGVKGNGGAYHKYSIALNNDDFKRRNVLIYFQHGPRHLTDSLYGVLDADLLEIVRHRLQCFQEGEFATFYNGAALYHIQKALECLNDRAKDRIARGVLGTKEK